MEDMNSNLAEVALGPIKEAVVKIDNVIKSIPSTRAKDSKSASARPPAPNEQTAVSDQVRLTSTSEKMRQLENELSNVGITDAAKVESIRQAIADGSFKVDEEAVAESLIQESIATIGRQSRQ